MDRRVFAHVDGWLLFAACGLACLGFVNLHSASVAAGHAYHWRQLQWFCLGAGGALALFWMDYRLLAAYTAHLYLGTVALLALVLVAGKAVGGSQRWLSLGFLNFQPSELAKLTLVVVLASYFYNEQHETYRIRDLWRPALLVLVPAVLVYLEPDLGTAILYLAIFGSMVFLARLRASSVLILAGLAMVAMPLVWKLLKPYQRRRIETFLNPESDPLHAGYHVLQSKIAVGSGQVLGKGYMAGTQAHLNFLPEIHTDFAFSVWAEEWGFVGSLVMLVLFTLLLYRGLLAAAEAKDRFGAFLAFGITALFFWQFLINVGMVLGLMPVVGIPLPLVSYGGSSVLVSLAGIGLLLNVRARRFVF
ncbi:rod shape-determining protein RodA [Dissulfurirhabdus thermomarina]|uniref:Peptidoglycan glycosyltransferase RodA n=1 Tax=Dissulfurirhabdus thermomarina TaxID=1765737 RepID=A0A6N9TNR4_DISTH|nr:rod shape-determining protein RodA [Dissulfurirhabdus thermomarina]NDY42070.1 rod shape-determining protein RodA [Dissulfurirhabdus thermomarina]NMX22820.1 rod shape-determining protein RodA [Dissulfurirhabdus thermomarina]